MAYDPNDPADKKIVDDAVAAALATAHDEHEAEVTRLTNKNTELLGKLQKARNGAEGGNSEEIGRLERELEDSNKQLAAANADLRQARRDLTKVEGERDTFKTQAETEGNYSRNLLVTNGLTDALTEAKVAPHFMEAARALLASKVKVEVNGDERTLLADGKPVGDFVKEWAASDAGKHYTVAPANGGGGANGANGGGNPNNGKKLSEMSEDDRRAMAIADPAGFRALLDSEGPTEAKVAA